MSGSNENVRDSATPILIIDDNEQYSRLLAMMLKRRFGYTNVTTTESAGTAYELISQEPEKFRLLFVDFNLPTGISGGDLLEKLRGEGLLNQKAAFLITAEPTLDNFKRAVASGACGVVAKPFDSEELEKQLQKAERAARALTEDSF